MSLFILALSEDKHRFVVDFAACVAFCAALTEAFADDLVDKRIFYPFPFQCFPMFP